MYNSFDENVELSRIEPEYTAMFCAEKEEVTFFYNDIIVGEEKACSQDQASNLFDKWSDSELGS